MNYGYSVAGLRVASDICLSGLIADSMPTSAADVVIARASLPPPNSATAPLAELIVEIPGLMRMAIRHGSELNYDPVPGADVHDLALWIGGTGFGALLHQRGRVVLHASAVLIGDDAVLFCGASGAGKSTLAAALVDAGHGHIADDFCTIDFDRDGVPTVAPDGRRHKLWQRAIDGLDIPDRRGRSVQSGLDKYFVDPRQAITTPRRIGAIYALNTAEQISISPVSPLEVVRIVQSNAFRPQMVGLMRQQQLYFETSARLARRTAIRRLDRPLAFNLMPELINAIRYSVNSLKNVLQPELQ